MGVGGNTGTAKCARVDPELDWWSFDQLPKEIREFCQDLFFDYSAEQLLYVWEHYAYRDKATFKLILKTSDQQMVQETANNRNVITKPKTTAYERAVARSENYRD